MFNNFLFKYRLYTQDWGYIRNIEIFAFWTCSSLWIYKRSPKYSDLQIYFFYRPSRMKAACLSVASLKYWYWTTRSKILYLVRWPPLASCSCQYKEKRWIRDVNWTWRLANWHPHWAPQYGLWNYLIFKVVTVVTRYIKVSWMWHHLVLGLKMEVTYSPESMVLIYQTTWRTVPKESDLSLLYLSIVFKGTQWKNNLC